MVQLNKWSVLREQKTFYSVEDAVDWLKTNSWDGRLDGVSLVVFPDLQNILGLVMHAI